MAEHQHGVNCGCSDEVKELANVQSLLPVIDTQHITCFNESQPQSGRKPFKPYTDRLDTLHECVTANDDESELLFIVPFTVTVKLRSLNIIHNNSAITMKLFINRDDIDMSNVNDIAPVQQLDIPADNEGTNEYTVKVHKFHMTNTLILYCVAADNEPINISYLCLKGDKTNDRRAIVHAVYEARAIPEDHTAGDEAISEKNTTSAAEGLPS